MERISLIDFSSEDNLLIGVQSSPISGVLGKCGYRDVGSEAKSDLEEEISVNIRKQVEQVPELSESPEKKQMKSGKYNLRKSLAWDNAFFTNEGVLNTEELATVNSTFRKAEARALPGIKEVWRSSESNSTLDGDCWGMENLEADLSENLQASIQKSICKYDSGSALIHPINTTEKHERSVGSSKVGPSQTKMKSTIAVRSGDIKHKSNGISSEVSTREKVAVNGYRDTNTKTLLKPPRIATVAASLPSVPIMKASGSGNVQIKDHIGKDLSGPLGIRGDHDVALEGKSDIEEEILVNIRKQIEQVPELSESPEKKQTKSGKYNLRKSLAWDNAFFTSEGVLDTEELATVNSTFTKDKANALPGIKEEVRSLESISTLDGDCWGVENLEDDLLENLQASIQKSIGKYDRASALIHPKNTTEKHERSVGFSFTASKVTPSQTKMKAPVALRSSGDVKQKSDGISSEVSIRAKVAVDGCRDTNTKTLLKPPRIATVAASLQAVPSKKASGSGNFQIKGNIGKTLSGNNVTGQKSVIVAKKNLELPNAASRSIPSPKFSKASPLAKDASSLGSSSDSSGKITLENSRKRVSRYSDHHSSGSTTKNPLRASQTKLGLRNAGNPLTCMSSATFKSSSSVSPSSSIDSLVSESSSSKSIALKLTSSMESIDASDKPVVKPPTGSSRSSINSGSGANCFKPTGLRMPTPKLGYFDAEKSNVRSSSKLSQHGPKNSLLSSANRTTTNKMKSSEVQHVIMSTTQNVSINPIPPEAGSTYLTSAPGLKPRSKEDLDSCPEVQKSAILSENRYVSFEMNYDLSSGRAEQAHQIDHEKTSLMMAFEKKGPMEDNLRSGAQNFSYEDLFGAGNADGLGTGNLQGENQNFEMLEQLGRKVASLSLSETKVQNAAGLLDSGVEREFQFPKSHSKVSPICSSLGPNSRAPLVDKFC